MTDELILTKEITNDVSSLTTWAQSVKIQTSTQKESAVASLQEVKSQKAKIIAFFKDSKDKAYSTWKAIVAQEKGFTDKLDQAEMLVKKAILVYDRVEEEKRETERRRLQAIADEQARKERERLIKQAEKLKSPEKKEALLEQAAAVQETVVQIAEPEKINGATTRKTWKARIVDINLIPREWLIPNEKALDSFAKATKGATKIPGIEFYEEPTLAIRS